MPNHFKPTVVAVDDDPITLSTVLNILHPHYDVRPFASGTTALRFLSTAPCDLIILDCKMPEMDGFAVMDALRQDIRTDSIPILFLTAIEDGDSEVLALEKGAGDYLLKPIKPKVLLTRVRHQLELQRYRNQMETLVEEKTNNLLQAFSRLKLREQSILNMLAKATDMRDHHTGDHIWRTTAFVRLIVEELLNNPRPGYVLTIREANNIVDSSKLHDLGKIAIPDRILGKVGKLTEEEFDVVKKHTLYGAEFLDEYVDSAGNDPFLSTAREIALYHHEQWAGIGYPYGLKGKETPLSARIVALADVYDALVSERPYKNAFTHEKAHSIITSDRERHFDPYLVRMFVNRADSFRDVPRTVIRKRAVHNIHDWENLFTDP